MGFTLSTPYTIMIVANNNCTDRKGGERMVEEMTGKEIVNLIYKLEKEGMSAEKIIEIIKYVETADPKDPRNNE